MARLNLVIADEDEAYVDGMAGFLMSGYADRFQVSSFTRKDSLQKYLLESEKKVDILLVSPALYLAPIPQEKATTCIILTDGRVTADLHAVPVIYKYQHGDKLASGILQIFNDANKDEVFETAGSRKTRIISFFSPTGGSGKTSIAIGCSIACSQNGGPAFYLNLEHIQTTPLYFKCDANKNMSNIFYYMKEKDKNFPLRIQGVRCSEPSHHVHFFAPPDSILEMDEIRSEEINYLIEQLKFAGLYGNVLIDLPACADERVISTLKASDDIVMILSDDPISNAKMETFSRQIDILNERLQFNLMDKVIPVLNKERANAGMQKEYGYSNNREIRARIPFDPALPAITDVHYLSDPDHPFGSGICSLVKELNGL